MGNQKQKWTAEEEEALLAGISKHGPGKWKNILKDPEFAQFLTHRSNIDLKDKWRNLSVSTASQGSRTKLPKLKALPAPVLTSTPNSAPAALHSQIVPSDTTMEDPSNNTTLDGKCAPRFNALIFDALANIKDPVGADINAIVKHIENAQSIEVQPNFRRSISSRLRRLVTQGKLEKIQNFYKIKKEPVLGGKASSNLKERVVKQFQAAAGAMVPCSFETVEQAASLAASRVAEAENKSFVAAEAVKEAERITRLAEETDSMLMLVEEIYEQCARGEIVMLA